MSFKINIKRDTGKFSVSLRDDITFEQMRDIVNVAEAILTETKTPLVSAIENESHNNNSLNGQSKLGERPVEKINLGTYIEPPSGVRLRIYNLIDREKATTIKNMRVITGISLMGCKEIVYGNYPSPIFSLENGEKLIELFKTVDVFAKLVPGIKEINAA
jgi:ribosomal protein L7/L12